jgi:3-oxoacyl-[acyl-carrier protein] reductase
MAEVTKMDVNINDKVALVTGGSKGIGLTVARALAKSGATVAIIARGAEGLQIARTSLVGEGLNVRDYICDVSKASELKTAFDKVVSDFGKVDILVNNAGTSRAMAFETVTDEIWQADLDLKLFAAIRMSRLVWPGMKERRWGRITNVLNTAAKAPPAASAPTSVSRGRNGTHKGPSW